MARSVLASRLAVFTIPDNPRPPETPLPEPTRSILLLHVTGEDRPGITASLTGILGQQDIEILDINQTVIHRTLLLGMLVRIPPEVESTAVLKDLLFTAHHGGLRLRITPVDDEQYDAWVARQGKPRFILTLLARRAGGEPRGGGVVGDGRAGAEHRHHHPPLGPPAAGRGRRGRRRACVEFSVRGQPNDEDALRAALMQATHEHPIDIAWQRDNIYRRIRRLVAFDMDSTLIRHEVIDELAREAGVYEKVSAITEAAMRGEMDFDQSLDPPRGVAQGADRIGDAARRRPAEPDRRGRAADRRAASRSATRPRSSPAASPTSAATCSSGSASTTSAPTIWRSRTACSPAACSGEIINAQRKAELLREIAAQENISLQQTIAVGDGANDLPMLAAAGLGIAFHAKPLVAQSARHKISTLGLDSILYLIGVRDRDLLDRDLPGGDLTRGDSAGREAATPTAATPTAATSGPPAA